MIRWCAYCQTFQGEVPPLESYTLTHGMCEVCVAKSTWSDQDALEKIRPIERFFRALRDGALAGLDTPGEDVLERGAALGIAPVDLVVGMLQPALAELGERWQHGGVSVATEHRFTETVESVVAAALERLPKSAGRPASPTPDFLLVNADGNYHTLGLKVAKLILLSAGRSTFVVTPGLPSPEIVDLARALKPRVIGVSLALVEQVERVREISEALRSFPDDERPQLIVGGNAVKMGLRLDPATGARTCSDARELLKLRGPCGEREPGVDGSRPP